MKDSAHVTDPGAIINMIAAVSSKPTKQNKSTRSPMSMAYSSLPRPGWVNQFTCNEVQRSRARRMGAEGR